MYLFILYKHRTPSTLNAQDSPIYGDFTRPSVCTATNTPVHCSWSRVLWA